MIVQKHEVWREFCDLLSLCPTQYHKHAMAACLLSHILDDEKINDQAIMDSLRKTRGILDGMKKPCASVLRCRER